MCLCVPASLRAFYWKQVNCFVISQDNRDLLQSFLINGFSFPVPLSFFNMCTHRPNYVNMHAHTHRVIYGTCVLHSYLYNMDMDMFWSFNENLARLFLGSLHAFISANCRVWFHDSKSINLSCGTSWDKTQRDGAEWQACGLIGPCVSQSSVHWSRVIRT